MRNHLVNELERLAEKDSNIYVITGDLGYGVLNGFAEKFPDRFINAGISEQNMTAVAAGMALEGNTVYTYSIGNFPGMRCLEWIRNDICYNNANVKIIAVGSGFSYGQLGMSHHATEDIAIMRALPQMRIYSPADPMEAIEVVKHANSIKGPCYIRLGKGKEPILHPDIENYDIEKIMTLEEGEKIAVITTGSIINEVKKAVDILKTENINIGLYNVITIKPIDTEAIKSIACNYEEILVLEEHNVIGGLGSAVSEVVSASNDAKVTVTFIGLQDTYASVVGSQNYLRNYYGISTCHILEKVKKIIGKLT